MAISWSEKTFLCTNSIGEQFTAEVTLSHDLQHWYEVKCPHVADDLVEMS